MKKLLPTILRPFLFIGLSGSFSMAMEPFLTFPESGVSHEWRRQAYPSTAKEERTLLIDALTMLLHRKDVLYGERLERSLLIKEIFSKYQIPKDITNIIDEFLCHFLSNYIEKCSFFKYDFEVINTPAYIYFLQFSEPVMVSLNLNDLEQSAELEEPVRQERMRYGIEFVRPVIRFTYLYEKRRFKEEGGIEEIIFEDSRLSRINSVFLESFYKIFKFFSNLKTIKITQRTYDDLMRINKNIFLNLNNLNRNIELKIYSRTPKGIQVSNTLGTILAAAHFTQPPSLQLNAMDEEGGECPPPLIPIS